MFVDINVVVATRHWPWQISNFVVVVVWHHYAIIVVK